MTSIHFQCSRWPPHALNALSHEVLPSTTTPPSSDTYHHPWKLTSQSPSLDGIKNLFYLYGNEFTSAVPTELGRLDKMSLYFQLETNSLRGGRSLRTKPSATMHLPPPWTATLSHPPLPTHRCYTSGAHRARPDVPDSRTLLSLGKPVFCADPHGVW